MRAGAIADIEERLQDLIEALRETGAHDVAAMLERYAHDFTVQTRVRRSVNAITAHLERWREDPSELPESPKVLHAANRLEDVCREALTAGVIAAAAPTLAAQSRRKLMVVLLTLLAAGVIMLGAIAVVASGIDVNDIKAERRLEPVRVPRGEEGAFTLAALSEALVPDAVTGVVFEPLGACKAPLPHDATCDETTPRLWDQGRLPTYEIKLARQAYGLLFAITDAHVESKRFGEARLLLAATDETPEGPLRDSDHAPRTSATRRRTASGCSACSAIAPRRAAAKANATPGCACRWWSSTSCPATRRGAWARSGARRPKPTKRGAKPRSARRRSPPRSPRSARC